MVALPLIVGVTPSISFSPVAATAAKADLRADTNRDGVVDVQGTTDEAGKASWTPQRGGIFLPNMDDDAQRCTISDSDINASGESVDTKQNGCNDSTDEVVNGADDEKDLAPLRILPSGAASTATGTLTTSTPNTRLFVKRNGAWTTSTTLTAAELNSGVEAALEGKDVIRDTAKWDGLATVTLKITEGSASTQDAVQLRVAPLLLQNDLKKANQVWINNAGGTGWSQFASGVTQNASAAGAKLTTFTHSDRWAQDFAEPGTVSFPGANGQPQVMHLILRSANVGRSGEGTDPRHAGRLLYKLRGKDVGVVHQFSRTLDAGVDQSLNSTGNFDSVPPFTGFPNGRSLYGATSSRKPDQSFTKLLQSQGFQQPITIDTSWLLVGHVDETTHTVPAKNSRGWTMVVADPRLAVQKLKDAQAAGSGSAALHDGIGDGQTVSSALTNTAFMSAQETTAQKIDTQLATLSKETGLATSEFIRVPVLFRAVTAATLADPQLQASLRDRGVNVPAIQEQLNQRINASYYVADTPAAANGLTLSATSYAAPDPHGPKVGGTDVFKQSTLDALKNTGLTVSWVEDWSYLHLLDGEVHCGSNALRDPTRTDWYLG
ncbi:hypothetical protein D5S17_22275 [Pseudonocardiaceae bacterium YIM PH 21723]|nr:hypothetical protein D5S17_22275 [Pseudonocardiaceae bacterium YIM PH 21723]